MKSWPTDQGLAALHHAIQVHGSHGHTRDFDVEQLYRDSRLNPIHEGIKGSQAADLLGRKLLSDRGYSFRLPQTRIRADAARAPQVLAR
ncbi:hypothetical protein VQ02_24550 [Methylobacterium variabile]|uniref:Acyl-CoA dehydrogenase/oxidase C-terminal domain-containing protein n=1 Tax=Methylobacterium variabile TaxID=298794 RepID=A0A0J6SEJ8_9HYPH|nr:hypothetical protein VQ02_24550 [Methylobacterium variabile]